MKFHELKKHSIFVIPITPDIGKTKDEIKLKGYTKYIKIDDKSAATYKDSKITNHLFKIKEYTKRILEIPKEEEVILVED